MSAIRELLHRAADHAADHAEALEARPVRPDAGTAELRAAFDLPLPARGVPPADLVDRLARDAAPGLTATASPRYFGFVIGGTLPAALAADWLVSAWDQNSGLAMLSPAVAVLEDVAGRWLLELLDLPATASFAFTTGCQMAHVTALAAARHAVLARRGWDVERDGLAGAPAIRVLVGEQRHVTVDRALRLLGIGSTAIVPVPAGADGAMLPDALARALRGDAPTIVCAQAGDVNTGAVDPLDEVCDAAAATGAWVHVDGAFGLWGRAGTRTRALVAGAEQADSWATDAHKWLQVPYDCGFAAVADPPAHRAAMWATASYLPKASATATGDRDAVDWTPEFSRRARGVPVYAALLALGRDGVSELVDRLCACADRVAAAASDVPGFEVVGHALNQVLIGLPDGADVDRLVSAVQEDGTCWVGATTWRGRRCIRVSVCSHLTTATDVDRSVAAMAALAG